MALCEWRFVLQLRSSARSLKGLDSAIRRRDQSISSRFIATLLRHFWRQLLHVSITAEPGASTPWAVTTCPTAQRCRTYGMVTLPGAVDAWRRGSAALSVISASWHICARLWLWAVALLNSVGLYNLGFFVKFPCRQNIRYDTPSPRTQRICLVKRCETKKPFANHGYSRHCCRVWCSRFVRGHASPSCTPTAPQITSVRFAGQ